MSIDTIPITSRDEWLLLRHSDVTSTDVAPLAGLSPWKTPFSVFVDKTSGLLSSTETRAMMRGRIMEPAVIQMLKEERPHWQIERANVYLRDPDLRLGGTPDGYATTPEGRVLIEAKTVSKPQFDTWDGLPIHYQLQCAALLMLSPDCVRAIVPVMIMGGYDHIDFQIFEVERVRAAEERITELVGEFWQGVAQGIEPKADYGRDGALLMALRPPRSDAPLDLTGDNRLAEVLDRRAVLQTEIKERSDEVNAIRAEIIDKLGGAQKATLPGWVISYTMVVVPEHLVKESRTARLTVRPGRERTTS